MNSSFSLPHRCTVKEGHPCSLRGVTVNLFFGGGVFCFGGSNRDNLLSLNPPPRARLAALWQCTRMPGEAVYIPGHFKHAVVNLDEAVAAAVQANDVNPKEPWLASFEGNGKVDIGVLVEQAEAALGEDNTALREYVAHLMAHG